MTSWGTFAAAEPALALRVAVCAAASDELAEHHVLFELRPADVRCGGCGDVPLPETRRWRAGSPREMESR